LFDMDAVDLDHQQVQLRQIELVPESWTGGLESLPPLNRP